MELVTNEVKPLATSEATAPPPDSAAENKKGAPTAQDEGAKIDPLLLTILATKRRHTSTGDVNFRLWLFNFLKGLKGITVDARKEGNLLVKVGKGGKTLFSCHTDTVHSPAECDGSTQELAFDPMFNHIFLADKTKSSCLGGDDGCGIYIMLKMIMAKKAGWYMFHTGEEVGGVGSRAYLNAESKFIVETFKAVVAFDRPTKDGVGPEVISHQGGQRCASDEYCAALAKELNVTKFNDPYHVTPNGSFTDSKVYSGVVPECINVSCFYDRQHTRDEYVDYEQLELLTAAAIRIDWDSLPITRDPSAPLFDDVPRFMGRTPASDFRGGFSDEARFVPGFERAKPNTRQEGSPYIGAASRPPVELEDPVGGADWTGMSAVEVIDDMESWNTNDYETFLLSEPDLAVKVLARLFIRNKGLQAELDACENIMS